MLIKLTDGQEVNWRVENSAVVRRSKFQVKVGEYLRELYPQDLIFEEVTVPGERLVLDFFIPSLKLVVECQGIQHREYVPHYHKTRIGFHRQKERDTRKRDWCELNGFRLVEIPYGCIGQEVVERILCA